MCGGNCNKLIRLFIYPFHTFQEIVFITISGFNSTYGTKFDSVYCDKMSERVAMAASFFFLFIIMYKEEQLTFAKDCCHDKK